MSSEYVSLRDAPEVFESCPNCGQSPFRSFLRGGVQRRKKRWIWWGSWGYCAVICARCTEVVGWESPLQTNTELIST